MLIEGPVEDIRDIVTETRRLMAKASSDVLAGFELRTDVEVVSYPDRYQDKRGAKMWQTVMEILEERLHPPATPAVAPCSNGGLHHGVHPVLL